MAIRVKVDEDLPLEVAAALRNRGLDAITVIEQGWTGKSDNDVWAGIQPESRLLMTADKGFADIRRISQPHHGLILLRPDHESRQSYIALVEKLADTLDLASIAGAVVVVTDDRIRIRRRDLE